MQDTRRLGELLNDDPRSENSAGPGKRLDSALYPEPLRTEEVIDGFDVRSAVTWHREARMTRALPPFHRRALSTAEEVLVEARATKDAADRLLVQIDELISPPAVLGARDTP
jgi:hypothetical protein